MAFVLPTFNLRCGIWRAGNPTSNPPDVASDCNLALGRRIARLPGLAAVGGDGQGCMWLLLPPATDIQDAKNGVGPDMVEVPLGSGRFYSAAWVDDIGSGFSNEHRFAELIGVATWPTPFPGGSGLLTVLGGASLVDAVPIPFGERIATNVPAGTVQYFSTPLCCTAMYTLSVSGLPGAATVDTFVPPTSAPVSDIGAAGNGDTKSTIAAVDADQLFIAITADPVIDTPAIFSVAKGPGQVVAGGSSCASATMGGFPLEGRIFVPELAERWVRIPLAAPAEIHFDWVVDPSGSVGFFEVFDGLSCGALNVLLSASTSPFTTGASHANHTVGDVWIKLYSPTQDTVASFRLY